MDYIANYYKAFINKLFSNKGYYKADLGAYIFPISKGAIYKNY